ncbi:MAG: imelysin family protein [Flavobacterium sp.]
MKKLFLTIGIVFTAVTLIRCSSSGDGETPDNFDRTALLANWADNIIIPGYVNYQTKVHALADNVTAFNAAPNEANLQTLRTSWVDAYKSYQTISIYYLGKAAEVSLNESANTYPADAAGIEANIASGTYNLAQFAQYSRQGFPGLDYLINGLGANDTAIVAFYATNANAVKYRQYLTDVTAKLKSNIDAVVTDWNSGYRDTFVSSTGTGVSSSVNKTTNLFVKNLEKTIRTGKIDIPAGLMSSGTLYPDKVEAYYKNDISKELLNISIQAQKDFFNGKYANSTTTGPSLKSYLDYLNAVRSGQNLSTVINNQFDAIFASTATLGNSFSQQVNTDNAKMIASHNVIQQGVIYIKLDMMQALNISIDYVDGDGD